MLKYCPFCGGYADMWSKLPRFTPHAVKEYAIICEDCGATSGFKPSEEEAQAVWNRRVNNADRLQ